MRWQRMALFAAIVIAHVLVVLFFPVEPAPHESSDQDISFATLEVPELPKQITLRSTNQSEAASTRVTTRMWAKRSADVRHSNQDAASSIRQPEAASEFAP